MSLGSMLGGGGSTKQTVSTSTSTSVGVAANPSVGVVIGGGSSNPGAPASASPSASAWSQPIAYDAPQQPNAWFQPGPSAVQQFPGITDAPASGLSGLGDNLPLIFGIGGGLVLMALMGKKRKG